jgi:dsDNA-binding SOS-regulon protein
MGNKPSKADIFDVFYEIIKSNNKILVMLDKKDKDYTKTILTIAETNNKMLQEIIPQIQELIKKLCISEEIKKEVLSEILEEVKQEKEELNYT